MRAGSLAATMATLAIAAAAVSPAAARERTHTVVRGESASSLAKAYYGDAALGDLLLRYNGVSRAALHPGDRLTIPYCRLHTVRAGETWSGLARSLLGRATAARALAELNGSAFEAPLRVGESVVVPVIVRHTLARGETLGALAARYYGDERRAELVADFGRIADSTRLPVGAVVEVPVTSFRKKDDAPPSRAPAAVATRAAAIPEPAPAKPPAPPSAPRYGPLLDQAEGSFAAGDYEHARHVLESLRAPVSADGTADEKRRIARLLAFVYVAFDLDDEACRAYRSAPEALDVADLDPDRVSPRIRDVLSRCPPPEPISGTRSPSHADAQP